MITVETGIMVSRHHLKLSLCKMQSFFCKEFSFPNHPVFGKNVQKGCFFSVNGVGPQQPPPPDFGSGPMAFTVVALAGDW